MFKCSTTFFLKHAYNYSMVIYIVNCRRFWFINPLRCIPYLYIKKGLNVCILTHYHCIPWKQIPQQCAPVSIYLHLTNVVITDAYEHSFYLISQQRKKCQSMDVLTLSWNHLTRQTWYGFLRKSWKTNINMQFFNKLVLLHCIF